MLEETTTRSGRLISDADSVPPAWDDDDNGGSGRRRKSLLLPSLFGAAGVQQDSSGRRVSLVARLSGRLSSRRNSIGVLDVQRAAMHIHDAVDGVCRPKPQQGETARQAQLAHLAMQLPLWCTLVVYVLLTFFECPGWAVGRESFVYSHPKEYPFFGLPVLPRWWAAGIELTCLLVLIFELSLRVVAQGPRRFFRYWRTTCPMNAARRIQSIYFLVLVAALVDALATLATPRMSLMVAPYLRLACIVLHSDVLLLHLYAAARTLPSLFSVAFVLAAFLLFFGWLVRRSPANPSDTSRLDPHRPRPNPSTMPTRSSHPPSPSHATPRHARETTGPAHLPRHGRGRAEHADALGVDVVAAHPDDDGQLPRRDDARVRRPARRRLLLCVRRAAPQISSERP